MPGVRRVRHTSRMQRRRRGFAAPVLAVVLPLVLGAGCGRYASKDAARTTTTQGDVAVGAGVGAGIDDDATTTVPPTTATTAPPTTARGSGTAGGPGGKGGTTTPPRPANQSVRDDPSGLRMTLVVGGDLTYGATEDIVMQLDVENISKQVVHWDPNVLSHFYISSLESSESWRDSDCRGSGPNDTIRAGASTIAPGEKLTFKAAYPTSSDRSDRDRCRKKPGPFNVFGRIEWCPPGSVTAEGDCAEGSTREVRSAPVEMTITP